jgi:DNA-binding HxlR family transcriptional regulator
MLRNDYSDQVCSIARALEIVGERWTLLILRDVFLGIHRFDDLQSELGIARNVLASRLERLVDAGILEKRRYLERPPRYEYRLTQKGRDLWPVTVELLRWGDRHAAPASGPPTLLVHEGCGGEMGERRICGRCGAALGADDVRATPGPGASPNHPMIRFAAGRAQSGASG